MLIFINLAKTTKLTNFLKEIEFYEEKEIMEKYY
jgi:hypothetical protein